MKLFGAQLKTNNSIKKCSNYNWSKMWHKLYTVFLKLSIYSPNVSLCVTLFLFIKNYYKINDVDYLFTTQIIKIYFSIYLIMLISISCLNLLESNLSSIFYKLYFILFVAAIFLSATVLLFDFDKYEKIKQKLQIDIDLYNKHQVVSKRLENYQAIKKCCGIYSEFDYLTVRPSSCINSTTNANFALDRLYTDEKLKAKAEIARTRYDDQIIIKNDGQLQFVDKPKRKFKEIGLDRYGNILEIRDDQIVDENVKFIDDRVEYQEDYRDFLQEYFYKDGCLAKLHRTHSWQKQMTSMLLYNLILTSFISLIINYNYFNFGMQNFSNVTKEYSKYHLV